MFGGVHLEWDVSGPSQAVRMQIYIPKIPGIPTNYEYSPLDFHLEYEVRLSPFPCSADPPQSS